MKDFLYVTVIVLATRLALHFAGLAPDAATLLNHMQVLDFEILAAQPIEALWWLHMQPPLWNMLVAGSAIATDGDPGKAAGLIHVVHIGATLVMAGCILFLGRLLGCGRALVFVLCLFFVLSPPVIYFETYIFYSHLSATLVLGSVTGAFAYLRSGHISPLLFFLTTLAPLPWLWSIFHPVAISVFAFAIIVAAPRRSPWATPLATVSILIVFAPTLKSVLVFGQPTTSSWLGFNISQTVQHPNELEFQCRFSEAFEDIRQGRYTPYGEPLLDAPLKSSGFVNANHALFLERGPVCVEAAVEIILEDPFGFAMSRLGPVVESHGTPSHYYFFGPIGWDMLEALDHPWDEDLAGAQTALRMVFAALILALLGLAIGSKNRSLFVIVLAWILYFETVSHLLNGQEQQRMRYTIEPLYFLVAIYCIDILRRHLVHRTKRTRA